MRTYANATGKLNTPPRVARRVTRPSAAPASNTSVTLLTHLQRTLGNRVLARLLTQDGVRRPHVAANTASSANAPPRTAFNYPGRVEGNRSFGGLLAHIHAASAQSAQRRIQRALNKKINATGWGGSTDSSFLFNPHADITIGAKAENRWFLQSPNEEVEVAPDTHGTVVIYNPFYWFYHEINTTSDGWWGTDTTHAYSYGGPVDTSITATFSVDKDGKVVMGMPLPNGIVGLPSVLEGDVKSDKQDGSGEGSVNIRTILKSTKTVSAGGSKGSESSGGLELGGIFKGVGIKGNLGGKSNTTQTWGTSTTGSGVWMGSYGITLRVKKTPPIPVTAKIKYNREGKFVSGDEGIDGVNAWWTRIPEPVRTLIKLGKKPVFIYGNASKTGNSTINAVVAANRLNDVQTKLLTLNKRMDIVPENTGSTADERSVVIEVKYTPTEASE
jgi:hypothetical protein